MTQPGDEEAAGHAVGLWRDAIQSMWHLDWALMVSNLRGRLRRTGCQAKAQLTPGLSLRGGLVFICSLISSLLPREKILAGSCLRTESRSEPGTGLGILS